MGVVLRAAKSVRELPVRPEIVQEARNACAELRLIGKARKRARRPTPGELEQLRDYFAHRDKRSQIPMLTVLEFALASARRESEICRLEWRDNDERTRTGLVRDAKHPTAKEGNHRRFKYTPEGWALVQPQPRSSEYIFPYEPRSIGAAFTRACHVLGIKDLRFHDLRHEATSRLFERGYQIHEVAQFTLHDSWNELKRYANLKPENVRDLTSLRTILTRRFLCLRKLRPASVDQLGEIGRTDEPGRLLSAEAKHPTWQHLCGRAPAGLFVAQTEVLGCDARQRNIGFAKFRQ
jgi:integrase